MELFAIKLIIYLTLGIIIYLLSLRIGQILVLYHGTYQEISSIEPDNSIGFNLIYRIIFTPIILIIVGVIFQLINRPELSDGIWIISVLVALLQIVTLVVLSRIRLVNFKLYATTLISSILLSYYVDKIILPLGLSVLMPDPRDVSIAVVVGVITFIYGVSKNIPEKERDYQKRVNRYIDAQYKKFNKKYKNYLTSVNSKVKPILLSIMIYEDYNRPKIIRFLEKITHAKTQDILQVTGSLSDGEGIRKTANYIDYCYGKTKFSKRIIMRIFKEHNPESPEYAERTYEIYKRITKHEDD